MLVRSRRRAEAAWESRTDVRARALATAAAILGDAEDAGSIQATARAHVIESELRDTIFWQPWPLPRTDERSRENLLDALSDRRGVLLSDCHLGPFFMMSTVVAAVGGPAPYSVGGVWFFETPTPDLWGRRLARWRGGMQRRGTKPVRGARAFAVLKHLLGEGETIVNHFDVPGHRQTSFLGKPTMLTDGTARLAMQSGALVLPVQTRRARHRVWVDVGDPLDPHDFDDAGALHDELARIHSRFILAAPWALESPHRPGSWEEGATPASWTLPAEMHAAASGEAPI
jgi:lauroyl/myristoyl acyltransferase